jgi:hypothetical protein
MITKKLRYCLGITLVVWLLAGCGGASRAPTDAPTALPPTATPIPPTAMPIPPTATPIPPTATPIPPTATPVPLIDAFVPLATAEDPGDFQPLSPDVCSDLADAMAQTLGVAVTTAEVAFQDYVDGKTGTGCQATATWTGLDFENVGELFFGALTEMLQARGWLEDINYAGGGPGGMLAGYRQAEGLCLLAASSGPSEDSLCAQDEPFVACWERLAPEQQIYIVTLNCAQYAASSTTTTETLSIDSFTAEAVDNGDGGKTVTFNWQTSGATGVRIFNGATFVRFGTWWTDLPLDGTHTVDIATTAYKNPQMTLYAADAQGNEISQAVRIDMPCQVEDKFRGNSSPPGTICPAESIETAAAEQRFSHGFMIWLEEVDGGTILVFYDDGRANQFADTWQPDQPESDPNITPPDGMYQPLRGFGKIWRENNLQDTLGWAIEEEQGFDGKWQRDMSASPGSDTAFLINRDFQLIRINGPTSSGNWEFSAAVN